MENEKKLRYLLSAVIYGLKGGDGCLEESMQEAIKEADLLIETFKSPHGIATRMEQYWAPHRIAEAMNATGMKTNTNLMAAGFIYADRAAGGGFDREQFIDAIVESSLLESMMDEVELPPSHHGYDKDGNEHLF